MTLYPVPYQVTCLMQRVMVHGNWLHRTRKKKYKPFDAPGSFTGVSAYWENDIEMYSHPRSQTQSRSSTTEIFLKKAVK